MLSDLFNSANAILGFIASVITIVGAIISVTIWLRVPSGSEQSRQIKRVLVGTFGILGVIAVCAVLAFGARAILNSPASSANNNSQSVSSNGSTDTPTPTDTPIVTSNPTQPPAPPSIVSFTVDQSNVPVGTTVHFTIKTSSDISPGSGYDLTFYWLDPDTACNTSPGCNLGTWTCASTPMTCTGYDLRTYAVTVAYQVSIIDSNNQQVGATQTLSVTWS